MLNGLSIAALGESGLVSVIIPTYKRAALVCKAIDSVLAQDHPLLEIIVVDDGSPDDTGAAVSIRYATEPRVRYVRKTNGGLASARNVGIRHARGEFIAFLDDDDAWQPWKLAAQVSCLTALAPHGVGMIWTDFDKVGEDGQLIKARAMRSSLSAYTLMEQGSGFEHEGPLADFHHSAPGQLVDVRVYWGDMFSQFVLGNLCLPSSMVVTRERALNVGDFDVNVGLAEDHDYNLRCCRAGPVALLDAPGLLYRVGSQDQMTHSSNQLRFAENFLRLISPVLAHERQRLSLSPAQIRSLLASAHGWLGYELLENGSPARARRHLLISLRQRPGNRRNWLLFARSFMPAGALRAARTSKAAEQTDRVVCIDNAKCIGMFLVFYGHVMQSLVAVGNEAAWYWLRLIYSFHMPLFFLLAGYFFRPAANPAKRVEQLILRRLLPVVFFSLLLLPLWSVGPLRHHQAWWPYIEPFVAGYLLGKPLLDWVTWFLVCLFLCECMALVTLSRLNWMASRAAFGFACLGGGVWLCDALAHWTSRLGADLHATLLPEAVVALGFYAVGAAVVPQVRRVQASPAWAILLLLVAGITVWVTYLRNEPGQHFAVMMAAQAHGQFTYFVVTALAGSAATIALGALLPSSRVARYVGTNALVFMGLNGIFFAFVNPKLASMMSPMHTQSAVILYGAGIAVLSMCACVPAVFLLDRYLPQLIGRSQVKGPWLPALEAFMLPPRVGEGSTRRRHALK